jgi:hypothetical protein
MVNPFLTLYTPTYKRPQQLARCLASVGAQTAADDVEQIVIVDHVGRGIGGMYAQVPAYVDAVHGRYVHVLADDDVLASPTVVEQVRTFADTSGFPPLILVTARKGGQDWPTDPPWPPQEGHIDLGCAIVRADWWRRLAGSGAYGPRYAGDFDFVQALYLAGVPAVYCPVLFLVGAVSHGVPEAVA